MLSYLANGVMADRMDYHIEWQSVADSIIDGMLPANDMLVIRKQVSILDMFNASLSTEAQTIVFYTQIDVDTVQAEGNFKKLHPKGMKNWIFHPLLTSHTIKSFPKMKRDNAFKYLKMPKYGTGVTFGRRNMKWNG